MNLPCGVKIGGVGNLGAIPVDVTFLVVPASAWPASPKVRGFGVVSFDRRARVREDFDRDMLQKRGIRTNPKCCVYASKSRDWAK